MRSIAWGAADVTDELIARAQRRVGIDPIHHAVRRAPRLRPSLCRGPARRVV